MGAQTHCIAAPNCRKHSRRRPCQSRPVSASQSNLVLGMQGMFPRGRYSRVPSVNGSPGDSGGRVVRTAPSWKHLELQSETHRHGNKGNNAAPRLTALFPIFTSITFLGLSRSNSDKSHKNCKCASLTARWIVSLCYLVYLGWVMGSELHTFSSLGVTGE